MKLDTFIPFFKFIGNVANNPKQMQEDYLERREEKRKRVLESIFMEKLPDRVPVVSSGTNFFPAKYANFTCEDYMFDFNKNLEATIKLHSDFEFDTTFLHSMFAIGKLLDIFEMDLIKIPGRELDPNVSYQWNEVDRLEPNEYQLFLDDFSYFSKKIMGPRISGFLKNSFLQKIPKTFSLGINGLKYLRYTYYLNKMLENKGKYNFFATAALPPYDILSFTFRTIKSLSRDLMKRDRRELIISILQELQPRLMDLWLFMANLYPDSPGIFFPSERAFSLSPRQFEKYYWPTLKPMIIKFVEKGKIPILTWEGNTQHLVHFLLELPKSISRKCVFNCDTTDILKANKILDGHMAIWGTIPLSTMCVGTPKDIEKYLDSIFPEMKEGGGYAVSPALGIPDEAKPENVRAMIDYVHKNGNYA